MGVNYNTSIVREGLVLHLDAANPKSYPGSGNIWFDLTKNSNSTLANGVLFNDNFFTLDGINDYINTNTDSIKVSESISYEFVLKVDAVTENKVLFGKYDGASPDMWMGILASTQYFTAGFYGVNSTFIVTDNVLRHYIITYNKSTGNSYMYVNGKQVSSNNLFRSEPRGNLMIGKFGISSNFYFPGQISFIKIYNRQISLDEAKQNFEALRGRYGI